MDDGSTSLTERLRLGIEAARAGQHDLAREHFVAVLQQDDHNIPAMLWLAFVASDPHDSLRLLKLVLTLEPDNERAQAGLRWARGRLGIDAEEEAEPATGQANEPVDPEAVYEAIRQQFLADDVQRQARKGPLAHRARRTINPLLALIIVAGAVGLLAIGLKALLFIPASNLVAWLPVPTRVPDITALAPETELLRPVVFSPLPATAEPVANPDALELTAPPQLEAAPEVQSAPLPALSGATLAVAEIGAGLQPHTSLTPSELPLLVGPRMTIGQPEESLAPVNNLSLAHQPAYPGEKWIEVNVTTQQVTAWEGDVPVMSFVVSTGLPNTPTILGEFNIYWKLKSTLMVGQEYYLPEVPYTMYFFRGYALHGTYWHNNFGQPMSHGCVNLNTDEAKKLFEWADPVVPPGQSQVMASDDNPGTLVVVHE